ncbi:hypothetical protein GVN21_04030 [Caulobacter sp. SLTY]|uniref:beta strand repeat-containing protein n=1 Tax=Caulobacter sp. SLTY TaxID=2683262 RepID=UPI0014129308|nr:hypothetical protein [Caulobacter sp. SLTY]NBB14527.1 hypothetical protein [Caulobacter sp. SLTY]
MANIVGDNDPNTLPGTVDDDTITGLGGNDVLEGGEGNDTLNGGTGNDTLNGGNGTDTATFIDSDEGVVGNVFSVQSLSGDETDTLISIENLIGSNFNDQLVGDNQANVIWGRGGQDVLIGQNGDDTLYGEDGDDILRGRNDNDNLYGGIGNDFLQGGEGNDLMDGGDGFDRANFFLSLPTDAQVGATVDLNIQGVAQDTGHGMDTLVNIEHVSGTTLADTLTGDAGANWLWGQGGGDTINGGGGDDLIEIGSAGAQLVGGDGGTDTLSFFNNNDFTSGVVFSLLLQGTNQAVGGGVFATGFENLSGSTFNDTLTGDAGDNVLSGAEGADILSGGQGNDTLYGDGIVWMYSTTGGSGPITTTVDLDALGIGAVPGNDTLYGGEGSDILEGGAGDDLLLGGIGNDTIRGGAGIDTVSYEDISVANGIGTGVYLWRAENQNRSQGDGGFDIITGVENVIGSQVSDTLEGDGGDNVLTGLGGNDALVGHGGNDTLVGGAGEDFLRGRDGDDLMQGGADNDFLQGGEGNDTFDGGDGFDRASLFLIATDPQTGATVDLNIVGQQDTGHGLDTFISVEHVSGTNFGDTLTGNSGDNWLWGVGGGDTLNGGDGNDNLETGSAGANVLNGGDGIDTANFFNNNDFTSGVVASLLLQGVAQATSGGTVTLTGIENLSGSAFNDVLTGDAGGNVLAGNSGADTLDGGEGDDILLGDGAIRMTSSQGGSGPITQIEDVATFFNNPSNSGNDILRGGAGIDTLIGSGGDDLLLGGLGNDTINGGAGIDTVSYEDISVVNGIGVGVYLLRPENVARSQGDGGADLIIGVENVIGSQLSDTLDGDHNNNVLTGLGGNDLLIGEGGDDTLIGGSGEDFLRGRDGNDVMQGGADNDFLSGGEGNDTFDGGDGIDRASMFLIPTDPQTGATVDLSIVGQQDTGHGLDTFISVEHVSGTSFGDTLSGNSGDNWLWGIGGGDTLNGADGNDLLETGSAGANVLNGGNGVDTASFFNNNDFTSGVVASLLLQGVAQATSGGTVTLNGIENLSGSTFNDVLTGDTGNNVLAGAEGNDELVGGEGNDTLYGDGIVWMTSDQGGSGPITFTADLASDPELGAVSGNDILRGGAGSDILEGGGGDDLLLGGLGNDTIRGGDGIDTVSYEDISVANGIGVGVYLLRPENVNRSQGDGGSDIITGVENVIGSQISDTLDGDHNNNVLTGLGGNDLLIGEGGDDTLDGGAGEDFLRGRDGNDIAYGGLDNDFFSGGEGNDVMDGGEGFDRASMFLSLPTDIQIGATVDLAITTAQDTGHGMDTFISIEHVSGTTFSDTFYGNDGANWLWGTGGNDTLDGRGGDDLLEAGIGTNILTGGDGIDTVRLADNINPPLNVVLSLQLQGAAQDTGSGMMTLSGIENLTGTVGNDALTGDGVANTLAGAQGEDSLVGGGGNDLLLGDGDIRMVSNQGGSGPITVIENLATFFSNPAYIGNDHLVGGEGDDRLVGGGGDDLLDGGSGTNILEGGDGFDTATYAGSDSGVTVLLGNGTGTAQGPASDTLSSIERVVGSEYNDTLRGGVNADSLDGDDGSDTVLGQGGDDIVNGGGDDDFVRGGDGNDLVDGGFGNDYVHGGEGDDTIDGGEGFDRVAFSLQPTDVQVGVTVDLGLQGVAQDTGHGMDTLISIEHASGTNLNDSLTGDAQANWLWGQDGNDTIVAGEGDDLIEVGSGNHTVDGGLDTDTLLFSLLTETPTDVTFSLALQGSAQSVGAGSVTASGFENLSGRNGNDTLTGDEAANTLAGASGDDTLDGGDGADLLVGDGIFGITGIGYSGEIAFEADNAAAENDPLLSGSDTIYGGAGDDRIVGGGGSDYISGGDDTDTVVFSGARADYDFFYTKSGELEVTDLRDGSPDGIDTVVGVEFFEFSDGVFSFGEVSGLSPEANDDLLQTTVGQASSINASLLVLNDTFAPEDSSNGEVTGVSNAVGLTVQLVDGQLVIVAGPGGGSFDYTVQGDFGSSIGHVTVTAVTATGGADVFSPTGDPLAVDFHGLLGGDTLTGTANSDRLVGGLGNDTLNGGGGADVMEAGAQNDTYHVDDIDDQVIEAANEGDDLVISTISYTLGANLERLTLTGRAEYAGGNALNNTLIGTDGANILNGFEGADVMRGGLGDDTYHVDSLSDVLDDTGGVDTVITSLNTYVMGFAAFEILAFNGFGNFTGTGNGAANTLLGGDGNDRLDGQAGNDIMAGGLGDDTYVVAQTGDSIVEVSGAGTDTIETSVDFTLSAEVEILRAVGSSNLILNGNVLDNQVFGANGNDIINGGLGADQMAGGLGNDTYHVDNAGDAVTELASQGDDLVISSVSHDLGDNVERLTLTGTAAFAGGNALNNTLTGNAANNILDGRGGADLMRGGLGDDTYHVDNVGDVVEDTGGADTVITSLASYTLGSGIEILAFNGFGNFVGNGNGLNNTLLGGDGNDRLDGGIGFDAMAGGLGDDTYVVGQLGDTVFEVDGVGTDTIETSVDWTLGDFVENLTGTGGGNVFLTGNALNNVIIGNSGINTINGGLGADQMSGGLGNDTYIVDNVGDTVTELAGQGALDTVNAYVDYTLSAEIERLVLLGTAAVGTGNAQANTILGNALDNILDGGGGADSLQGGLGNDTYYVDNVGDVISDTGVGLDQVFATIGSFTLSAALENLTFIGSGAFTGTGNTLANVLVGGAGNDTLSGLDGNDTLDGGQGADTLNGGVGNDTYVIDDAGDTIADSSGIDTVRTSLASYTLAAVVENLTFIGSGAFTGNGNALGNILTGGAGDDTLNGLVGADTLNGGEGIDTLIGDAGNDILDGGLGADIMSGGAQDDIYVVDDIGDVVNEGLNAGTDTIRTTLSTFTLGANVERLAFIGSGAFNGTGNDLLNTLTGGDGADTLDGGIGDDILNGGGGIDNLIGGIGADTLDGGAGVDIMDGGVGNDTYIVDDLADVIIETLTSGTSDRVRTAMSSYTLGDHLEGLAYTGSGVFTGTGNALANILTGGTGSDTFYGMGGGDDIRAGMGVDTLYGGDGVDKLYGEAGDDFLLGEAATDYLYGGAGADTQTGGAGADYFTLNALGDSGVGAGLRDVITDFDSADFIDLRLIDANTGAGGDQAFSFIGNGAFTNVAGQLRYSFDGVDTHVFGDVNGDGVADFEVLVNGSVALNAGDFLL